MTLPDERTRAVLNVGDFLRQLTDPFLTPRVPKEIRERALRLLRHYPSRFDMSNPAQQLAPYERDA